MTDAQAKLDSGGLGEERVAAIHDQIIMHLFGPFDRISDELDGKIFEAAKAISLLPVGVGGAEGWIADLRAAAEAMIAAEDALCLELMAKGDDPANYGFPHETMLALRRAVAASPPPPVGALDGEG